MAVAQFRLHRDGEEVLRPNPKTQPPRPARPFRSLGSMRHSLFLLRGDLPVVGASLI